MITPFADLPSWSEELAAAAAWAKRGNAGEPNARRRARTQTLRRPNTTRRATTLPTASDRVRTAQFRDWMELIHTCRVPYVLDVSLRPTRIALGRYYRSRKLIRIYPIDRVTGLRPADEIFDVFLHEIAHHLEYTEPDSFGAEDCQRIPGRAHSLLFHAIWNELQNRWAKIRDLRQSPNPVISNPQP